MSAAASARAAFASCASPAARAASAWADSAAANSTTDAPRRATATARSSCSPARAWPPGGEVIGGCDEVLVEAWLRLDQRGAGVELGLGAAQVAEIEGKQCQVAAA